MACLIGSRVVRGPDWNWADQDGGDGHLGTVCEIVSIDSGPDGTSRVSSVKVVWDCGKKANYRTGHDDKYDLRLYSDSRIGIAHTFSKCHECYKNDTMGMRWKCSLCANYILCEACYHGDKHDMQHAFLRLDGPHSKGMLVSERGQSKKTQAMGIFPGATVKRGPGWKYDNQDGGKQNHGIVTALCGYDENSVQTAALVEWPNNERRKYRLGHEGEVDLRTVTASAGGTFYKDHMPVLGEDQSWKKGTKVMIATDENTLMRIHGETYSELVKKIGKICTVDGINEGGHVIVCYATGDTWAVMPFLLKEIIKFDVGDKVRVSGNVAMVKLLQNGHGGWIDHMKKASNVEATVIGVDFHEIKVSVINQKWRYHHGNLILLKKADLEMKELLAQHQEGGDDKDIRPSVKQLLKEQKVLGDDSQEPGNDVRHLVRAAEHGELDEVAQILLQNPALVDTPYRRYTALQIASHEGHVDVVKHLLKVKAMTEVQDDSGDTALHFAVIGQESHTADCLLHSNADVNARNKKEFTALHIAAAKGDISCAEVLLKHGADINSRDNSGLTALHLSIYKHHEEFALNLLRHPGIDLTVRAQQEMTPLHFAIIKKHPRIVEEILRLDKSTINLRMKDGLTPLHLAAANGNFDIGKILLDLGDPDLSLTGKKSTALHLVTWRGHTPFAELLLQKGSNPSAQDKDGDNCLHLAVKRRYQNAKPLQDSNTLRRIQRESQDAAICNPADAFICLFIQAGTDLNAVNKKGRLPWAYLDEHNESNIKDALLRFAEKYRKRSPPKPLGNMKNKPSNNHHGNTQQEQSEFTIPRIDPKEVDLLEVIGQGGFGRVHKARWRGTEVAAKIMSTSGSRVTDVGQEIRIHERALHPNIVRLMAIGYQVDEALIIMQFIDGTNLGNLIFEPQNAELPYQTKLSIATDILSALTFLHATKILHLDIKPSNILVENKSKKAYLCDLGLAHIKNRSSMTLSTSLRGGPRGTPGYLPPEMITGESKGWAIAGNDIWSAGCTFLEMFTGKNLWPPRFHLTDIIRTFMSSPDWVPSILQETGLEIRRILEPCFKRDPRQRTPAEGLLKEFETLKGHSID